MLNGVLTVDHKFIQFDGTESWGSSNYFYTRVGERGDVINDSAVCSHAMINTGITSNNDKEGFRVYNRASSPTAAVFLFRESGISTAYMDVDGFKEWLAEQAQNGTPLQVCFELAEPIIYQLTPQEVKTLLGQNNLWADCGDVTVTYRSN